MESVRTCVDNYATRTLCGEYALLDPSPTAYSTYLCARSNLEYFFFFTGTTERLTGSLCVLQRLLDWKELPSRGFRTHKLYSVHPSAPPEDTRGLDRLVTWDRLLHAYADDRLSAVLRQHPACAAE